MNSDYLQSADLGPEKLDLKRYNSKTGSWDTILKRVTNFGIQDKFMYASVFKYDGARSTVSWK